jgi:type IV secretory pathway VirB10-like protein
MTGGPELSPDMLDERRGVRRLNRVPLLIAGLMLLLILAAVTYTYQMRLAEMQRTAREAQVKPEAANPSSLFRDAPDGGFIPAKTPEAAPPLSQTVVLPPEKSLLPISERDPYGEAWERYRQEQERLAQQRNVRMLQAIGAPTRVQGAVPVKNVAAKPDGGEPRDAAQPQSPSSQFASLYASEIARQRRLLTGEADEDLNRAAEKRAFLTDREPQTRAANYLVGGREAPLAPYEVKAGTVIPAIMVGGVNSDLPGQLIGQVAENVYDTATGRYILIPQGSKLVGTYDNAITTGQSRVLVAWTRIIYPDASSIDLGKMPGADQSGFAGFKDKVDNHFWEMFSSALLMSVFSAGVQISQGGSDSGNDGESAQQTIAAGLGQQLGQLGQELARRNARIQPTLEIRPGYRFTVMVTKDMVIRPWKRTAEK